MKRASRSHTYTPEIAAEICRRIADGEALRRICGPGRMKGVPERVTVYNWLHRFPEFMKAYLVARRAQAELYIDEVVEIADGDGSVEARWRYVSRDRLRVDTRLQVAKLMAPRIGGGAGVQAADVEAPAELDDGHAAARIAAILEEARVAKCVEEGVDPFPVAARGG